MSSERKQADRFSPLVFTAERTRRSRRRGSRSSATSGASSYSSRADGTRHSPVYADSACFQSPQPDAWISHPAADGAELACVEDPTRAAARRLATA